MLPGAIKWSPVRFRLTGRNACACGCSIVVSTLRCGPPAPQRSRQAKPKKPGLDSPQPQPSLPHTHVLWRVTRMAKLRSSGFRRRDPITQQRRRGGGEAMEGLDGYDLRGGGEGNQVCSQHQPARAREEALKIKRLALDPKSPSLWLGSGMVDGVDWRETWDWLHISTPLCNDSHSRTRRVVSKGSD